MSTVHEYRCPNGHGRRQRLLDAYARDLCCSVCEALLVVDEESKLSDGFFPFGNDAKLALKKLDEIEAERRKLVSNNTQLQNDLSACEGCKEAWRESAEDAEEALAGMHKELVAHQKNLTDMEQERDEIGLQLDAAKKHNNAMAGAIHSTLAWLSTLRPEGIKDVVRLRDELTGALTGSRPEECGDPLIACTKPEFHDGTHRCGEHSWGDPEVVTEVHRDLKADTKRDNERDAT